MIRSAKLSAAITAFLFACILGLGWLAYAPALSGAFMLVDFSNLADIETVNDNLSALRFVFSGTTGPLGRPVALASFLPQADAWSEGVRPFLTVNFTLTAGTMLSELSNTARQSNCNGVDAESVRSIAESLRQNPRYVKVKSYNHFHHKLMASIYRHEDNMPMTLEHLRKAKDIFSSDEINMMIVASLASEGNYDAARSAIAEALEQRSVHPVKRYLQTHDMTELGHYVDALEEHADQNDAPQSDTGTPTT